MSREVSSYLLRVGEAYSDYKKAAERMKSEAAALADARDLVAAATEAQQVLQAAAQKIQQDVHQQIAAVVSHCLQAVFDEPYTFHIVFDRKRGRTEARLVFRRGDLELDPMKAAGGGVVDVAAFALRLSCIMLTKPPLRRLLVLDEPFRFVSPNLRPRIAELLRFLSKKLKVQIIMVTHMEELQCGTVVQIGE